MSRIGKKIIAIPEKTEVTLDGRMLMVKGPLGTLSRTFKPDISITIGDNGVTLVPERVTLAKSSHKDDHPTQIKSGFRENKALWGTYGSHIKNMIAGVNTPFIKKLIIEGIGYKSEVKGDTLALALGFSHPVNVPIPKTLKVTAEKNIITVTGMDKEAVGEFVATVRSQKKPEPYKGKGIRYEDEIIKRKQGKKTV